MKRIIKSLWVALATLSALLAVVSCVKDLAVKDQAVNFESSLTTEQSQIVKGDSTVTTQLLINEEEVDCPRPTKYSVSFTYDEEAGTLFFLGDSIQSGKPILLSSLSDLALTYQAKKLVGNKVDVTVTNDAPKKLSKELVWNILADKTYWVKSEQKGDGEITITGADDLDAVKPDTKLAVTAKPADGWELVSLTANEEDILEDKSFVVTENTTVRAVFTKKAPATYAVTLTKEGEGEVAISGSDNLDAVVTGSKLTVTATPADGWEVKSITANGKDITTDKTFVVNGATDVKVVFARILFCNVVLTYNIEGATISLRGDFGTRPVNFSPYSASFRQGSRLILAVQPMPGYLVTSLTVNGKALSPSTYGVYDLSSYTNADKLTIDIKIGKKDVVITYVEENQTGRPSPKVQVAFKLGREPAANKWIDPRPSFTASAGSKMNIQVEYMVSPSVAEPPLKCTVTIGGKAVTLTRARNDRTLYRYLTYVGTFVVPAQNATLKVVFKN